MAMGKRRQHAKQATMWVATQDLPRSAAHPFYARLNQILDKHDFDEYVEGLCQRFYADEVGRPGLPPGRYFRLLLIGYFEGLDAERAIAWRAADSFALREFLGMVLPEAPPDHSTISRTRRLIDLETHEAVFTWMLQRLADAGLVKGRTVGIDATTLEANAALRSIVRRFRRVGRPRQCCEEMSGDYVGRARPITACAVARAQSDEKRGPLIDEKFLKDRECGPRHTFSTVSRYRCSQPRERPNCGVVREVPCPAAIWPRRDHVICWQLEQIGPVLECP